MFGGGAAPFYDTSPLHHTSTTPHSKQFQSDVYAVMQTLEPDVKSDVVLGKPYVHICFDVRVDGVFSNSICILLLLTKQHHRCFDA